MKASSTHEMNVGLDVLWLELDGLPAVLDGLFELLQVEEGLSPVREVGLKE